MKLNEIQDLIKFVSKSGVSEVELETKEIKIVIRTPKTAAPVVLQPVAGTALPVQQPAAVAPSPAPPPPLPTPTKENPATPATDDSKYITIKSPMIGTFYRSAGPDKPQFV